ncbi:4'-phosphopantetheinyl transferase superfamily protein [Streptomyces sp. NBC_00280]|uniref:4'-phosphopantetheinyl transferase family protein n=1 Tax=Streptomyces sp. NBC_00280 TaxID=2975699 RepID=UPI003250975E
MTGAPAGRLRDARPRGAAAGVVPGPGTCHLWAAPVASHRTWRDVLTAEEESRAAALPDGPARATYVTSRGLQRRLGSHYLRTAPQDLRIVRTCAHCDTGAEHGRPRFEGAEPGGIDYSVAHTRHWVLAAVVSDGLIGVDVDTVPGPDTVDRLARKALTPGERAGLADLAPGERAAGFLRLWTRKEAGTKLAGRGLAAPLAHLDATGPTLRAAGALPEGWPTVPIRLRDLPPVGPLGGDHRAALATTERIRHLALPEGWGP